MEKESLRAYDVENSLRGDIVEYDADRADVWHDFYDFNPDR